MVPAISCKKENMLASAKQGFSTATDLADYLVRKGLAFRDAHEVVGKAVAYGIANKKDLSEFSLEELKAFSADIENSVFDVLTLQGSVASRKHIGGTAPEQVLNAIKKAKSELG